MVSATFASLATLGVAFIAIQLFPFLDLQPVVGPSISTTSEVSTIDGAAVEKLFSSFHALLLFTATVILFAAVEFMFVHMHHDATAATVGTRLSELIPFTISTAAGVLVLLLFSLPAGVVVDDDVFGALARALGRAAVDALPASATVVFYLGITLVIAHIRAGGEGGGGEGDDGRVVPAHAEDVLKRIALAAAAALLAQIAAALYLK